MNENTQQIKYFYLDKKVIQGTIEECMEELLESAVKNCSCYTLSESKTPIQDHQKFPIIFISQQDILYRETAWNLKAGLLVEDFLYLDKDNLIVEYYKRKGNNNFELVKKFNLLPARECDYINQEKASLYKQINIFQEQLNLLNQKLEKSS